MSKSRTYFQKSFGISYIEINNATDKHTRILLGILMDTASKIDPSIEIEVHDSRLEYNEPKKLHEIVD